MALSPAGLRRFFSCFCCLLVLLVAHAASYPFETTRTNSQDGIVQIAEEGQYAMDEDYEDGTSTRAGDNLFKGHLGFHEISPPAQSSKCVVHVTGDPYGIVNGKRICFTKFDAPSTELQLHNMGHVQLKPWKGRAQLCCCRVCDNGKWNAETCRAPGCKGAKRIATEGVGR